MPLDFGHTNWHELLSDRITYWRHWLKDHPGEHATIDFETRSACDLKKHGSWIYSKHPSTQAMCLSYKLPTYDEPARWHPSYNELEDDEYVPPTDDPLELFAFILAGGLVEAHNSFFERVIWMNVMVARHGWPRIPGEQWRCSASRASAASLPRDLENACQAMGLDVEKDMEGRRLMLQMSKPRKPRKAEVEEFLAMGLEPDDFPLLWHETKEKLLRLFDYCDQDVRAEEALSGVIPELSPRELELWQLDQEFNERGVRFDIDMASSALRVADKTKKRLNGELFQITGIEKATQRQRIKDWLEENEGLELPDTAADTLERYIDGGLSDECSGRARRILEIVRDVNKTSTRKYQTAIDKTDPEDGRARDLLMFHGAGTGRWAGKGIQVQNFPRGNCKNSTALIRGQFYGIFDMDLAVADIKLEDEEWIAAMYDGGVMEALSTALRGMIYPEDGFDLICADYSAIEARCVLWLADDEPALNVFRSGGDIYCDMAEGIYGYPVNKKEHPDERQFGKQAILGLGYGMGFFTFWLTCKKYKISFTVEQVRAILKDKFQDQMDFVKRKLEVGKDANPGSGLSTAKRGTDKQATTYRRMAADAGFPKVEPYYHELALMSYTVGVYRKRYEAVSRMWKEQEAAAIDAVQKWRDALVLEAELEEYPDMFMPRGPKYILEDLKTPVGVKWRDRITGPTVRAGRIEWFCEGGFLCCRLPSGRLLRYRDPELRNKRTSWGENKTSLRYKTVVQPGNKWAGTWTYGGKLVENITQAVARDVMADAMLRSRGTEYRVIMTVHDEMVAEVRENEGSKEGFEALMSKTEDWAEGCPVTAEAQRYKRYRK